MWHLQVVVQPPVPPLALPAADPYLAPTTTARKVKVRVKDQLLLIPLPDPDRTVQWLRGKGEKIDETANQDSQFLLQYFEIPIHQNQKSWLSFFRIRILVCHNSKYVSISLSEKVDFLDRVIAMCIGIQLFTLMWNLIQPFT